MTKNELDEDLLSIENAEMEHNATIKKYIVEKAEAKEIIGDLSKYILSDDNNADLDQTENLNNNEPMSKAIKSTSILNGRRFIPKDKTELNLVGDEALLVKL